MLYFAHDADFSVELLETAMPIDQKLLDFFKDIEHTIFFDFVHFCEGPPAQKLLLHLHLTCASSFGNDRFELLIIYHSIYYKNKMLKMTNVTCS